MQTLKECQYSLDDEKNTFHLGVFHREKLISIGSFFSEHHENVPTDLQYRLRGMATLPDWRGRGAGKQIIEQAEKILRRRNADYLWCNARISARGYYDQLNFKQAGETFDLPPIGPHVVLYKEIEKH